MAARPSADHSIPFRRLGGVFHAVFDFVAVVFVGVAVGVLRLGRRSIHVREHRLHAIGGGTHWVPDRVLPFFE